jgi:hypothetical protein
MAFRTRAAVLWVCSFSLRIWGIAHRGDAANISALNLSYANGKHVASYSDYGNNTMYAEPFQCHHEGRSCYETTARASYRMTGFPFVKT